MDDITQRIRNVPLAVDERATVESAISSEQLRLIDPTGASRFVPGDLTLSVGGSQPDALSRRLTVRCGLHTSVTLV